MNTHAYRGCTIRIEQDEAPENPRTFDHVGIMACWHRRYDLGDVQPKERSDEYLLQLAREVVADNYPEALLSRNRDAILTKYYVMLPLFLYDHSGITMRTRPFECPWDSGQVGIIYCTMKRARREWPNSPCTSAIKCLLAEVKEYDQYLTGEVYSWRTENPSGELIDSGGNYYGYAETQKGSYMIEDCAKPSIDQWHIKQASEAAERLYWECRDVTTALL